MIRILLIAALSAGVAYLVFRMASRPAKGGQEGTGQSRRTPSLVSLLLIGLICAGVIVFILPRLGITAGLLLQKLMAFLPLVRAFLPF